MTLKEILEARNKALEEARNIEKEAERSRGAGAELTDEEQGRWDEAFGEYKSLKAKAARQKALDEEQREVDEEREAAAREERGTGTISQHETPGEGRGDETEDRSEFDREDMEERRAMARHDRLERRRLGLADRPIDDYFRRNGVYNGPSDAMGAYFVDQAAQVSGNAKFRERHDMSEIRALQADLDVSGGYLVPPQQWTSQLIKNVDDLLFIQQRANVIPVTSSDSLGAPALDTDPDDPTWTPEVGTVTEDSSMAFGGRELTPHQLAKLIKVSEKLLLVSAVAADPLVRQRLAYKLARTFENAYINGSGAGQPLGLFTASSHGISTSRDVTTDASTTATNFDHLKSVRGTLKQQYRGRAVWVAHRDFETHIAKKKDGEGQYLWQQSVQAGDPDRVLGFPLLLSELAPNTFTTGQYVAVLGDLSNYWIAMLASVALNRYDEIYMGTGQVGFRIKAWADGMPVLEEAFVRAKLA